MRKMYLSAVLAMTIVLGMIQPTFWSAAFAAPSAQETETRNVALNASATATGQCNNNEAASFAVDGRTDTKWCDNTSAKAKWLKLDLGKPYNINEWVVKNAAINESGNRPFWNTKDFRLQKSADGETWEDVDVVRNNAQTIVDRYVDTFTARYVRFYVDKGAYDNNTVRLYELELYGVEEDQIPAYPEVDLDPVDYVDPFINTMGDNGQTNPGPTMPFGLVSLGPDGDGGAFSGYYYEDKNLKGFSHLRFSGVGCGGAGGSILMMPETRSFTKNVNEYKQPYDKSSEEASPGYYAVTLGSGVKAELTASDNVGFHRYTFPEGGTGSVLVDLSNAYDSSMIDANLTVEGNNEISGMVQAKNVCGYGYYKMYYSIQFDHDFGSFTSWAGDSVGTETKRSGPNSGVWLDFNTSDNQVVQAKVGLSPISVEQAKAERDGVESGWDFDAQHEKTRETWSDLLGKVEITDADEENKRIFYTQMYHTFLHPKNVTSSAGTFRAGRDENTIRQTSELGDDFEYYNGWTTWDDFRKYALFSVLTPKEYDNMVKSLADLYKTRGGYTQWGDGYWPSPTVRNEFNGAVLVDAYAKGFTDFDAFTALKGMAVDADRFGDQDKVSGQLEKAKSGYFPMKLAEMLGDKTMFEKYKQVAQSYKNLWNPNQVDERGNKTGFFTPNGGTVNKAEVTAVDKHAYQGNLWQYRWSASQDIPGMAELMGGKTEMAKQLMDFFERDEYMAVNEQDLDAPYLFDYLGYPYLTQYYAREFTTEVVTQKYHNHGLYAYPLKSRIYRADPEGYLPSMDDDAGAMASWFVYGAMGLFPGNPGDPYFVIGSPIFSELKLHLDNGNTFTIKANGVSSDNRFIQSAKLNGADFDQAWIGYRDLMAGGTLEFEMGDEPNYKWGASAKAAPPTMDYSGEIDESLIREPLIAEKSEWKYFDKGRFAGEGWTSADFDDSGWASGQAMLGYGSAGDIKTRVSYGPDSANKYPTTYFRKTFEAPDVEDVIELNAGLVRDDGAIVYLNGHEIIRTNMPEGEASYDDFANATVNEERDLVAYRIDPSYLVEGTNVLTAEIHQANATNSDIAFEFALEAVKKLAVPAAPTAPAVDDKANTFGWTFVPGFEQASDYEFSTDGGASWQPVTANPQTVGPLDYNAGQVQVRVKADVRSGHAAGLPLSSDKPYASDIQWDVFDLDADVTRAGNMVVNVTGTLKGDYVDSAVAVIQLMDGDRKALVSSAVPVETGSFDVSQAFNVSASAYQVNVYLVDDYNGNIYDSLWLAEPIVSQPEPMPDPETPEEPGEEEPLPEPLPIPEDEPETPEEPEEPGDGLAFEFEGRSEWSSGVNQFNHAPLKTESNNGGVTVSNTFDGAWLSYKGIDFGSEGANKISVTYDAPSQKAPLDSRLELRLGSADGELAGTVRLPNTGGDWGTYGTVDAFLDRTVTGAQDLYIVMKGSTTSSLPYIGNFDRFAFSYEKIRNDYAKLELETFDDWSTDPNPANNTPIGLEKGKSGQQIKNTFNGAWLAYKNMDFGSEGVNRFAIEYSGNSGNCAPDSTVEVRLGSVDGTLVGKIAVPPTASGWGTYKVATGELTQTLTGMQDVYLVLTGTTDPTFKYIGNFDNASFSLGSEPGHGLAIEFESRDDWSGGALKTEGKNQGTTIGGTYDGAWLAYRNVDFGTKGANSITVEYDAPSSRVAQDSRLELRLGGVDGELIGTAALPHTGESWDNYKTTMSELDRTVTGKQDLYVVMKASTTGSLPYVGNFDRFAFGYVRADYAKLELEAFDEKSAAPNPANNTPIDTEPGKSGLQIKNTFAGAWLAYKQMNFGSAGVSHIAIEYAGNNKNCAADAAVEIRLGGVDGELVGTVAIPPTGGNWTVYETATGDLIRPLTGIQDVYLVLKGTTDSTFKYVGNLDNASFSS